MGMSRHHRNTANITREQKMKNFTAAIILLLAGSGWATPQFRLNLGQLFGPPPSTDNNQQNTNDPLQDLFRKILNNTEVSIGRDGIKLSAGTTEACPPLLDVTPPPGCNMRFDEGDIPCWDDTDCPSPGTCKNEICDLYIPAQVPAHCNCPNCPQCAAVGMYISYSSPISGQSEKINSCSHCSQTTCPPSRPCRSGKGCYRPKCNKRGRCWCPGALVY